MKSRNAIAVLRMTKIGSTAIAASLSLLSQAGFAQAGAPSVQNPTTPRDTPPDPPTQTAPSTPTEAAGEPERAATVQGDIIVTAQRREQLALKTPLSLTALDSSLIENKQVTGLADLQFAAPGIRSGQQGGVNRLFIRGIGLSSFAAGADASVAFYVDGIYIGRPTQQLTSFYDIARVEVLRGPQGALYGRNATGGAVNLISNDPARELGGYVNLSLGNYGLHQGEGAISVPLTANGDLRARFAFKLLDRDGYGFDFGVRQPINDAHSRAGRVTLQYNPNNDIDVKFTGEYTHEKDGNNFTASFGAYQFANAARCPYTLGNQCVLEGVFDGGFQVTGSQDGATALQGDTNKREGYAATLNARFNLNDVLSLNSITGWRKFDRFNASNADGASTGIGNITYSEQNRQFSQELVLNYDSGPLQATAGVSYYHEKLDNYAIAPFKQFPNLPYIQDGMLGIDAYAAYLQATYSITPSLRLTAAGRYSTEKRTSTGTFTFGVATPIDDQRRWSAFTPKVGVEYDVAPGTLAYASFTKGFKSGTFNIGQLNPAIDPERIEAYEAGIKSRFLDNMVDVTAAFFHYDYSDLQVNKIVGIATLTTNAAAAKTNGFEAAINVRPVPGLTLDANFTYLDSSFTDFCSANPLYGAGRSDFVAANPGTTPPTYCAPPTTTPPTAATEEDLKGKMLPGSPKYAFVVGGRYVVPVGGSAEVTLSADLAYQSRIFYSEFNDGQLSERPITKVNASVKLDTGHDWSVTVWGKNVFDTLVANNKILGIALWGLPIYGAYDPPATVGATLAVKF